MLFGNEIFDLSYKVEKNVGFIIDLLVGIFIWFLDLGYLLFDMF